MTVEAIWFWLGVIVVASPALLLSTFGLAGLLGRHLEERTMARLTAVAVCTGLAATIAILVMMLAIEIRYVPIELGNWVVIPEQHFQFKLKFVFDRLSLPFAILTFVLCGVVGAFTTRYLHREPGYRRFFIYYALFFLGMVVSSLAGTIETLFFGWELVGLSSALLVAFFHDRQAPVRNGQRVWAVYRIADASFLLAALALHHLTGAGDFDQMTGTGAWPLGIAAISVKDALIVGFLLLIAAAGKSALIPFSGWLPRAMEGPTPSSAVFYGALSVHLGAFLLLRVSPILGASPVLRVAVITLGVATAIYATLAARVQTDIKSALAFASLTQVGIIVAEIGFGLHYIPLVHILGHASLRTLQLLRAPSLLHDYHAMENAIGSHLPRGRSPWVRYTPTGFRVWLYRFALERGYMDALLNVCVVRPFVASFRLFDSLERRWTDFLSGRPSRESDRITPYLEHTEELS